MVEYLDLRPWKEVSSISSLNEDNSFTILSYNILSQNHIHRSCYPYCDSITLKWPHRRELLTKELLSYNADICCFQEMDRWKDFWNPFLVEKMEYDVLATERIKNNNSNYTPSDVNCITWKRDKFELIASKSLNSLNSQTLIDSDYDCAALIPNVTQIVALKPKNVLNPICLIIATTHLFWRAEGDLIRKEQIEDVVNAMIALQKEIGIISCEFILAGDLNADPSSFTIKYLTSVDECPLYFKDSLKMLSDDNSYYPLKFTTYCQYIGVLDYILYSSNRLCPTHIRSPPEEDILRSKGGLPNHTYASDHIALEVKFSF